MKVSMIRNAVGLITTASILLGGSPNASAWLDPAWNSADTTMMATTTEGDLLFTWEAFRREHTTALDDTVPPVEGWVRMTVERCTGDGCEIVNVWDGNLVYGDDKEGMDWGSPWLEHYPGAQMAGYMTDADGERCFFMTSVYEYTGSSTDVPAIGFDQQTGRPVVSLTTSSSFSFALLYGPPVPHDQTDALGCPQGTKGGHSEWGSGTATKTKYRPL